MMLPDVVKFQAQAGRKYVRNLLSGEKLSSLSAKAFLATEQRIPGLGNGVAQDILFTAKIHSKRKMSTLSEKQLVAFRCLLSCRKKLGYGAVIDVLPLVVYSDYMFISVAAKYKMLYLV
jgi:formamidopyrimidine-DNA glycosylase